MKPKPAPPTVRGVLSALAKELAEDAFRPGVVIEDHRRLLQQAEGVRTAIARLEQAKLIK